jgi:hypothetical protein
MPENLQEEEGQEESPESVEDIPNTTTAEAATPNGSRNQKRLLQDLGYGIESFYTIIGPGKMVASSSSLKGTEEFGLLRSV